MNDADMLLQNKNIHKKTSINTQVLSRLSHGIVLKIQM